MEHLRETHRNRQEGPNGDREKTEARIGGAANRRERSGFQTKGGMPPYKLRPPDHALTLIIEKADPSLVTYCWVYAKPCLVTVDTGCIRDCSQDRHRRRMARKTEPTLHAAVGICESPPHLEKTFPDTKPGAAHTENLSIRRQYHKKSSARI
jgi:hypothetical protein